MSKSLHVHSKLCPMHHTQGKRNPDLCQRKKKKREHGFQIRMIQKPKEFGKDCVDANIELEGKEGDQHSG